MRFICAVTVLALGLSGCGGTEKAERSLFRIGHERVMNHHGKSDADIKAWNDNMDDKVAQIRAHAIYDETKSMYRRKLAAQKTADFEARLARDMASLDSGVSEAKREEIRKADREYFDRLRQAQTVDFDDMIADARVIKSTEEVIHNLRAYGFNEEEIAQVLALIDIGEK